MRPPLPSPRFGTPASIDRQKLFAMPLGMQREGALMLLDMGLTFTRARRHLGLSAPDFGALVDMRAAPLRRGGDTDVAVGDL